MLAVETPRCPSVGGRASGPRPSGRRPRSAPAASWIVARACRLGLALVLAAPAAAAAAAPAPTPATRSPYAVDWAYEVPLTATIAIMSGGPYLIRDELEPPWCGTKCDPSNVNPLDRTVIGNRSEVADKVSTGLFYSLLGLPYLLDAIDVAVSDPADGWEGFGADALVIFESMTAALAVTTLYIFTVQRPRPLVYDTSRPATERLAVSQRASFFSGHTSVSFAVAGAYAWTFTKRHPDSPWVVPVWVTGYLAAGTVGVLRVEAGEHFWTDFLIGVAIGVTAGIVVPALHTVGDGPRPRQPGTPPEVTVRPVAGPGGIGALVLF